MKYVFLPLGLIAFFVLGGAGCSNDMKSGGDGDNGGGLSRALPEQFYARMEWSHVAAGKNIVADVDAKATVDLIFTEVHDDENPLQQFSVEGDVVYDPATFECMSGNPGFSCTVGGATPGQVTGVAYAENGLLHTVIAWNSVNGAQLRPAESVIVKSDLGDLPAMDMYFLQSSLAQTSLFAPSIRDGLEVPFSGMTFVDDYEKAFARGAERKGQGYGRFEQWVFGTDAFMGEGSGVLSFYREDPSAE